MKNKGLFTKTTYKHFLRALTDFTDAFRSAKTVNNQKQGKRILIFNWRDTKHAFAGGAEVYIQEMASRWVRDGNEVTIFCGSDGKSKRNEIIDGVQIVRRGGFYFVYLWAMLYYLVRFRSTTDIIVDCENGIPFFTPLYSRKKKFLLIHHVHQEVFRKNLRAPLFHIASFLEGKLMPFLYRNVQIITVSPSSKEEIMSHKLTKREPHIVYNGIDRSKFIPGLKNQTPMILYVGRLQAYKSLHILLKSVKQVVTQTPDVSFVIAGDGEDKRRLIKLAKELGIEEKVTFLGKVTEEEKIRLFQRAWIVVNPSLREGWGITTIEANACETPVIASNVSGLKDSIKNADTGMLVQYGNVQAFTKAMQHLLTSHEERLLMGARALQWASLYSWEASAGSFYTTITEETLPLGSEAGEKNFSYYLSKLHTILF